MSQSKSAKASLRSIPALLPEKGYVVEVLAFVSTDFILNLKIVYDKYGTFQYVKIMKDNEGWTRIYPNGKEEQEA